jgi:hypothetical protein
LEEVFENREQIEISKFYERLPKPHSIAIAEMREGMLAIERPAPELPEVTPIEKPEAAEAAEA